jgi:hypothetical protein
MKIEVVAYIVTAMVGLLITAILWLAVRHRLPHLWRWRLVLSLVLAASLTPTVFPPLFGSFWQGTVFPAVLFIPSWLGQVFSWNLDDILWGFIYFVLPIIVVASLVFSFWPGTRSFRGRDEKRAT